MMKDKPADRFNWNEGIRVMALESLATGDIVTFTAMYGPMMAVRRVTANSRLADGPLFVAKHDIPGPAEGAPPHRSYGIILPWLCLARGVSTEGAKLDDPVYLGEDARPTVVRGKAPRVIGRVLRVGPASTVEDGDPDSGAVLIAPNWGWTQFAPAPVKPKPLPEQVPATRNNSPEDSL